ncbi:hypothetical protein [Nocardioides ungokensis]|uniref:hypothetical protein n=1 Tax=Nocardioides ungokensis TaxID=1643322 RepID=UPI001C60C8D0|nr:hypothetical protein [Nocardioides ungokensis]
MSRAATAAGVVPATEEWFLHHGLSYFVPEQRHAAREALRPRRLVPILLLVALAARRRGSAGVAGRPARGRARRARVALPGRCRSSTR